MNYKILLPFLFSSSIFMLSIFLSFNKEKEQGLSQVKVVKSEEPFDLMMKALTHQRCLNCHPSDDIPRQGEDSHLHYFGVRRGVNNHGLPAMKCRTCHQKENNDLAGVPGAPNWHLAPKSMAWQGLTRVEIAQVLINPAKNGGKTLNEIVKHLTEDELVLWAWNPGVDSDGKERERPPVNKEVYIKAVKDWAAEGAIIPAK